MLDIKRTTSLLAAMGAAALMLTSAPSFAQAPAPDNAATAPAAAAPASPDNSATPAAAADAAPTTIKHAGSVTPITMFMDAEWVVKIVMIGLLLASMTSWAILIMKLVEFGGLNRSANKFVEAFRGARSISDINKIATSEEFEGNPLADMAAAASGEVELSRQAGLQVAGENRDSTITRASSAVAAVQSGLAKRLSGGMTFLASVGSAGPFVGLFGTVYGICSPPASASSRPSRRCFSTTSSKP
jgi:biopolymer transport protein ExbB